ncbi:MAG: hypothetical protein GOMPHAMPRED_007968 [Gomphillus americanus]|uniref:Small ribosomal subunit protein mS33 n=1 Tax=Gomphillus americanus TaxID=1940652 RepID=A0A8H3EXS8_9LECA|nr:MAG: hypothetical protein GOMPHAMPRED_007968 [Gomphillus americanus]
MAVPQSRILDLIKTQCRIFSTIFNPERLRLGNKILRQRLKGPSIAAYYPPRPVPFGKFRRAYKQMGNTVENEDEDDRLEKVEELKARGKGQWQERRGFAQVAKKKKR